MFDQQGVQYRGAKVYQLDTIRSHRPSNHRGCPNLSPNLQRPTLLT